MQQLASQLLTTISEELRHCRALLSALDRQRDVLLARDASGVLRVSRAVEILVQDIGRAAAERSKIEAELLALTAGERARRPQLDSVELSPDAPGDLLSESDCDRWHQLNRKLAETARRIDVANEFNQQLVIEALAYQDLMLRLLGGHADEDTYPADGEHRCAIKRPARKRTAIPVFLNQSA